MRDKQNEASKAHDKYGGIVGGHSDNDPKLLSREKRTEQACHEPLRVQLKLHIPAREEVLPAARSLSYDVICSRAAPH